MIDQLKSKLAEEIVTEFLENMQKLGFQKEETISLLTKTIEIEGEPTKGESNDDTGM